jgi:hypothetical protein
LDPRLDVKGDLLVELARDGPLAGREAEDAAHGRF